MNADMLESFDFRTLTAENGKIGLDQFMENPDGIDLVITDINMPVMDGPTMITEMLKLRPDLPVIAVSGLSEQQHMSEGTGLHGIQILSKPYSTDQLLQAVSSKLASEAASGSSGSSGAATSDTDTISDSAFDDLMGDDSW